MMTPGASQSQTTQALFGISGIFLINGVIVGSLATHFAALKTRLAVDPQVFSLVVMAMVAGTILAIGLSNWPLRRFGSACVLRICVVAAPLAFVLPSLSPSPALAAGSLFVLGGAAGLMDVAMNVHASTIERIAGRLVMARIHAVWSVGGILGAVTTGYALDKASPVTHSVALATLALIAVFFLTRLLLPASADKGGPAQPWSLPPGQILPIAGLVFLVIFCAGAMRDWSAVYLSESFATDHTVSAWGFAAFSGATAFGRVFGDKARLIFGPRAVVIFGGVFGATAMGIGLALGSAVGGITAMGFLGLAHATLVPLLFSLAGKIKTGAPATNISSVMAIGFCGQIIGPPLIGAIAQQFGLATGMFCIVGASALVALLAVLVLARDE